MIGRTNRPESEITRRIQAIRSSKETTFRGLLSAGEFDLNSELRFRNLSGLSFAGEDLRGIDFTGANLIGCDFSEASIDGCYFEHARLGQIERATLIATNLISTENWEHYQNQYIVRSIGADHLAGSHLPIGAIFLDSPLLPLLVALPNRHMESTKLRSRVATTAAPLRVGDYRQFAHDSKEGESALPEIQSVYPWALMTRRAAQLYLAWANRIGPYRYRFPYRDEESLMKFVVDIDQAGWSGDVLNTDDRRTTTWAADRDDPARIAVSMVYHDFGGGYGSVRLVREMG